MSRYKSSRPVMTAAELKEHHVRHYGRDVSRSSDGYDDIEVARSHRWRPVASWGREGWDLGIWPYVVVCTRKTAKPSDRVPPVRAGTPEGSGLADQPHVNAPNRDVVRRFELLTIVEGDHDVYRFETEADRDAAIDYLFLWHLARHAWAPVTAEQRPALDAGLVTVEQRWRGPFSPERLDTEYRADQRRTTP